MSRRRELEHAVTLVVQSSPPGVVPRDVPGVNQPPETQRPDLRLTRQGGHATLEARAKVLDWKGAMINRSALKVNSRLIRVNQVLVFNVQF